MEGRSRRQSKWQPRLRKHAKATVYKNLIDGEWVESNTGQTFENLNPADTREVVGIFQKSALRTM